MSFYFQEEKGSRKAAEQSLGCPPFSFVCVVSRAITPSLTPLLQWKKEVEKSELKDMICIVQRIVTIAMVASLLTVSWTSASTVAVHPFTQFQAVIGAGAAMTGSSAFVLSTKLSATVRNATMRRLFSQDAGAASFSVMRISIGSCDFDRFNFSLDDIPSSSPAPEDFNLTYFSLEHDEMFTIPMIRHALSLNPKLKIIASPWSAPAWMKVPRTLFGGVLNTSAAVRATYARYFRRFVEGFAAHGIPIFAVTVQNEPRYQTGGYPSMQLSPQDVQEMALRISRELRASSVANKTKVIVYDHNWDDPAYPIEVLSNTSVFNDPSIIGSAFHCYAGDVSAQSLVHDALPTKRLFFTECSGGAWAPNYASDLLWDVQTLVIGSVSNWGESVLKWNLALDESCGPHLPNGCGNCRGVVTIGNSDNVTFNEDFYSLAHLNYAMGNEPARRVFSSSNNSLALALASGNNQSFALLVVNPLSVSDTLQIVVVGGSGSNCTASAVLPPQSVATFVWSSHPATGLPAGTAEWRLSSGDQKHRMQLQPHATFSCPKNTQ